MAANSVILYTAFDGRNVRFSPLEKNKKGGKIVNVFYEGPEGGKRRIIMQTPIVSIPFGVTPYQEVSTGEIQSYSIDISFRNVTTDPKMADFLDRMRGLDDILLEAGVANSKEWFGKPMNKELVQEFCRKLIKEPSNPQYPPTMKVKVQLVNGEPSALFFDENRNPVKLDYFTKGTTCKMIMELSSVWFVNKNFGITWRLVQAAVVSRPRRLEGYSFQDDDVDDTGDDVAEEY